jgi:N-methylhydantoinase B
MTVDAISLEVFKQRFVGIAEEMGVTLRRASFSANIKERLDFSCAIFDGAGRMIAQAAHIPVHLGSMPASVAAALAAFPDMHPGDVIALNDPFHGGTHLPDITLVTPVFVNDKVAFFAASRAHHADVGGMAPGSLPLSTELYQEGLIIPPVRLDDGVRALIAANSRTPGERAGDLDAQIAAQHVGAERLRALVATHGMATVQDHAAALLGYTRRMTEAAIRAIPDGVYTCEDALEGDGQRRFRIPIRATITVAGDAMTIDFAGTAPQVAGNLNAVAAITRSAAWYCVRLLVPGDVPVNDGAFAPVLVIAPEGCLVNARFPAGVAVGNTETSSRIVDVVLGALAQALPDRIPAASQGTMNNVTLGGSHDGHPFVMYETIGGGHGAGPDGSGLSGRQSHMTNTLNTPIESLEYTLPLRITAYHLRDGSGGAGAHAGGDGIVREYEFLADATVTVNSERRHTAPYGLHGGAPGTPGRNTLIHDGTPTPLDAKTSFHAAPGDRLRIETPGGGGWGSAGGG